MGVGASNKNTPLYIKISSGETQSQQLYDFNIEGRETKVLCDELIVSPSFIVETEDGIGYSSDPQQAPNAIFEITHDELQQIVLKQIKQYPMHLWRVLKKGQLFPINPGSEIKIGKIKLKFKNLVTEERQLTEKDQKSIQQLQIQETSRISYTSGKSSDQQCRICFERADTDTNPLLCLCKCLGTVKYTHFQCLKDWIGSSVTRRESTNNCYFYTYLETRCEICKDIYQSTFQHKGKRFSLLELGHAPETPYAIFESTEYENSRRRISVSMIGLQKDVQLTIGRNSASEIIMKQISVSRTHCALLYQHNQLFISDKESKFGTLVKFKQDIEFSSQMGVELQLESKLIKIFSQKKLACCCDKIDSFVLKINDILD